MKKLFVTDNRVAIHLLKSKLEAQNIAAYIKNDNPPLAGELPAIIAPPELWVIHDEQYTAAQQILQHELEVNSKTPQQNWTCPQCGEKLETQFDVCWRCGTGKNV